MLTERAAIEAMFKQIQEELKQLKEEYRQDVAELEKRQFNLLDRLQRLDDIEREKLPKTMIQTIEKELLKQEAAHNIAKAEAIKSMDEQKQQTAAAAADPKPKKPRRGKQPGNKRGPKSEKNNGPTGPELIKAIEAALQEQGQMSARTMETYFKNKHGWTWANIHQQIKTARDKHDHNIAKIGTTYSLRDPIFKQKELKENEIRQDNIQPEAATV